MITKLLNIGCMAFVAVLLASCESKPKVFSDYDKNQDFSVYKTFGWAQTNPLMLGDEFAGSPIIGVRVKNSIMNVMQSKVYEFEENGIDADIVFLITLGARDKLRSSGGGAVGPGGVVFSSGYHGGTYKQGSMAIDIYDMARKAPVWHGAAKKRISKKDIQGGADDIKEAVESILASFPNRQP